jgi:uncharacterized protein YbjQ (UPF0145 family)
MKGNRLCPNCFQTIDVELIRCPYCRTNLPPLKKKCDNCGKATPEPTFIREKEYCQDCALNLTNSVMITTTHSFEGYKIDGYLGIESVEIVIGTGAFSEFQGDFADFFGQRSTAFEHKMQNAKQAALHRLKYLALQKGGNAIVGIDLDYTEFTGNRIGVIANGTIVSTEQI